MTMRDETRQDAQATGADARTTRVRETAVSVEVSRLIPATREAVFRAWTTREGLSAWYAPADHEVDVVTIDPVPGGMLHYRMHGPDVDVWGVGEYLEVVRPERIVFVDSFADGEGNRVSAVEAMGGSAEYPLEARVTVTLEERDGGTLVTILHEVAEGVPEREGIAEGWSQMLDRLATAV